MAGKTVKRTMADGTVKTYTYDRRKARVGTVEALIVAYRTSPEYAALAKSTKHNRARCLDQIGEVYGASLVADIRRRHIKGMRDKLAHTPGWANEIVKTWKVIMELAVEDEIVVSNVARGVKRLAIGSYRRWTQEEVTQALSAAPENLRRAIILGLYTGQRGGDVIRMTWADYDGAGIAVVQEKTGAKLWIPAHRNLRAELDAWKKDASSLTILVDGRGHPWGLRGSFSRAIARVAPKGAVFHGLRKAAAALLAEAGCSTNEIAAITGHKTLGMLSHYTAEADQKVRASAAIVKLENYGAKGGKGND